MVYVLPGTTSTFPGDPEIALENGYVAIDDLEYSELVQTKLMWDGNDLVEDPSYEERFETAERDRLAKEAYDAKIKEIHDLKKNLSSTDYLAIKHVEGWISDADYAPIKTQRQLWRNRINELES